MDLPNVYANELLHYRFGLPLWLPEPSPEWGPIKLADVGYIADGKFYRLFNASLPADDPSHERLGVPDGFEQLKNLETLAAEKVLDPGPLHSTTITQVAPGGSVSGATIPTDTSFDFKHTTSKGAVLVLKAPLIKEMLKDHRNDRIKKYVQKHSPSWETFANKKLGRGVKFQQITLVTHCYKTSSWTSAVSVDSSDDLSLKYTAGLLTADTSASRSTRPERQASIMVRSSTAVEGLAPDADQTVFVQGWKAKRFVNNGYKDSPGYIPRDEKLESPVEDDDIPLNLLLPKLPMELRGRTTSEPPKGSVSVASPEASQVMLIDPTEAMFVDNSFWTGYGIATAHDDDWCSLSDNELHAIIQTVSESILDSANVPGQHDLHPLEKAAFDGDVELVRAMLDDGAGVNLGGRIFGTPLQAAVAGGHRDIVAVLLDRGADIKALGGINGGALHIAVRGDDQSLIQLLLYRGAPVNVQATYVPRSPLQIASVLGKDKAVRLLLQHGADPNRQPGDRGPSPLRTAYDNGHMTIVRQLVENGAAINSETALFRAVLLRASSSGDEETVRALLESDAARQIEESKRVTLYGNALISASQGGHETVVRLLLSHEADVNTRDRSSQYTALQSASANGDENLVRLLFDHGADILVKGGNGTALTSAARKGSTSIVRLLLDRGAGADRDSLDRALVEVSGSESDNVELVHLLLDAGASVAAAGTYHSGALEQASERGHEAVARLLVERGADVNAGTEQKVIVRNGVRIGIQVVGGSPLRAASKGGHIGIVRLLLDHGADVNGISKGIGRGQTALRVAAQEGREDVVRLLLEAGADVELTRPLEGAAEGGNDVVLRQLLDRGATINSAGGKTNALQVAAAKGSESIVRLLLRNGADANGGDDIGQSPLQASVIEGHKDIVQLLLENGADVNAYQSHALKVACSKGWEDVVRVLLASGADVNSTQSGRGSKWSPIEAAMHSGNLSIVRILLENGLDLNARPGLFKDTLKSVCTSFILIKETAVEIVRTLLEYGARVPDLGGFYVDEIQSAWLGREEVGLEIGRLVIEYGAATNVQDRESTAKQLGPLLQGAQMDGNRSMVQLLLQCGATGDSAE